MRLKYYNFAFILSIFLIVFFSGCVETPTGFGQNFHLNSTNVTDYSLHLGDSFTNLEGFSVTYLGLSDENNNPKLLVSISSPSGEIRSFTNVFNGRLNFSAAFDNQRVVLSVNSVDFDDDTNSSFINVDFNLLPVEVVQPVQNESEESNITTPVENNSVENNSVENNSVENNSVENNTGNDNELNETQENESNTSLTTPFAVISCNGDRITLHSDNNFTSDRMVNVYNSNGDIVAVIDLAGRIIHPSYNYLYDLLSPSSTDERVFGLSGEYNIRDSELGNISFTCEPHYILNFTVTRCNGNYVYVKNLGENLTNESYNKATGIIFSADEYILPARVYASSSLEHSVSEINFYDLGILGREGFFQDDNLMILPWGLKHNEIKKIKLTKHLNDGSYKVIDGFYPEVEFTCNSSENMSQFEILKMNSTSLVFKNLGDVLNTRAKIYFPKSENSSIKYEEFDFKKAPVQPGEVKVLNFKDRLLYTSGEYTFVMQGDFEKFNFTKAVHSFVISQCNGSDMFVHNLGNVVLGDDLSFYEADSGALVGEVGFGLSPIEPGSSGWVSLVNSSGGAVSVPSGNYKVVAPGYPTTSFSC